MVLDETGKVILDSSTSDPAPENFSRQDYFTIHQRLKDVGLYIHGPITDRKDRQAIALSRRLSRADGSFAGVVLGTIQLSYFRDILARTRLDPQSVLTLVQTDGIIMMRLPFSSEKIGRDISTSEVFRRISSTASGAYEGKATIDGVDRIYAFNRVGTLPLIMTVGLSTDAVYAEWRREALLIGVLMILLCGATIGLSTSLSREWVRREAAERQLAALAETDVLSGLANRRKFDEVLAREWARAIRDASPLSLLMIDADMFKAYNDANGHQAGDGLLRLLAGCIRETLKRPADIAARYGGEEFVVLLPETQIAGAVEVAKKIHARIAELGVMHPATRHAPTVSIGAACIVPARDSAAAEIVRAADAALYAAKHNGRNCTEIAAMAESPSAVPDVSLCMEQIA
jgi:diguanylate cyclase (GGDEF)-like protein